MSVRVIVAVTERWSVCCGVGRQWLLYKQRWLILQYQSGTASVGVKNRDPVGEQGLTTREYTVDKNEQLPLRYQYPGTTESSVSITAERERGFSWLAHTVHFKTGRHSIIRCLSMVYYICDG